MWAANYWSKGTYWPTNYWPETGAGGAAGNSNQYLMIMGVGSFMGLCISSSLILANLFAIISLT